MYGRGVGYQFVQHFRAAGNLFVMVMVFLDETYGFSVAFLCFGIASAVPVYLAEAQQQHTFFYAVACTLLAAFFVGSYGVGGVFLGHVDVSHGVVHLVQILFVVVRAGHAAQAGNHFLLLSPSDSTSVCRMWALKANS